MVTDMELLQFIRRSVRSLWALRLLLLIRQPPLRVWSVDELVGELRASGGVVDGVLESFEEQGLVLRDASGCFSYATGFDDLCDALAEAYQQRPFAVMNAIVSPDDKLEALAQAFRWAEKPH
jgi:hypothetical protein